MSDWVEKSLGEILTLHYGWSLAEKNRVPGKVPVYGSNGVVGNHNESLVGSPGLVVGRKGSAGKVHYARVPFCPIDTTFFVTQEDTPLDLGFLYYLLTHLDLERVLGDVGVPGLNREVAYRETVRFPQDNSDQRTIASLLGLVQRAIEQQERLITLTVELKNAVMQKLFTEGLRREPQKETEIGPIPQSWELVKIDSLGKVVTGSTPKTKVPQYYSPPEVDFIAPADIGQTRDVYDAEKKISRAGLETVRRLPAKAVMCVCIGSSIGKVGMTTKSECATNQQINSIVCDESHDPHFIYYLLSHFADYWRGFATFGPVPILSKGTFENIKIAVPATKGEEEEIAKCFRALDSKSEVLMRKKATINALFRTLLHELMTARIRVHNLRRY